MRALLAVALMLAATGCSVTFTGQTRWSEAEPLNPDVELRAQFDKLSAAAQSLTRDLSATPKDADAIENVLKKYGIKLGGQQ